MSRKYFLIKLLNLILIFAMLFAYQQIAEGRAAKEAAALSKAKKEAAQMKKEHNNSAYKDGVYEGSAEGYGGNVTMRITIKGGTIKTAAAVSADGEDPSYWNMAKKIIPEIVETQSTDIDAVSGATYSSNGIINAAAKALQQAVR